uniref:Uncharacterized protein n=1 Tax=Hyaloperonospora arabidopsidis (strain Emoy2) TaxID=559515 RepID=M4B6R8_HYAAE
MDLKAASISAPSLSPILRQETQVSHVVEGTTGEGDGVVVVLKARLDLKVCRRFWDRPLLLVLHMTPKEDAVQVAQGDNDDVSLDIRDRESFGPPLLQDEYASSQLVSLTREQAQPTLLMTRCIEQHIVVTKPLRLALESRELAGQRVGILARVSNKNRSLALSVRNLCLHLDQSLSGQNAEMCRFRIVGSDKVLTPVVLQPQERYSFLFVLEPAETSMLHASPGLEGDNEVKVAPPVLHFATTPTPQHTSLTLSWKPITGSVDATTETCTIDWHPKVPSEVFTSLLNGEDKLQICIRKLVTNLLQQEKTLYADFKCVRLLPNSVLQMTVAPFASSVSIGVAVPASVAVVNRSLRTGFDLTLVHPSQVTGVIDGNNCAASVVVGFEGSQRLGYVGLTCAIS